MKNKLLKFMCLILCVLFSLPLLACNDESDTPPPEKPPQTNFYEEILYKINTRFYCYEQFDNVEDAAAYAKTWKENYEIYIPDIEDADSLIIHFATFRSADEKEVFCHKIDFEYTNAEPFYSLKGETTVYEKGQLDKTEFYIETLELIGEGHYPINYKYFYNENGTYDSTYDIVYCSTNRIGVKQNNFVLLHLTMNTEVPEKRTPEEIKALVLDNIVPVEEQKYKDKDISTEYILGVEVPIGPNWEYYYPFESVYECEKHIKYFCKFLKAGYFSIKADDNDFYKKETYKGILGFYKPYFRIAGLSPNYIFEAKQENGKTININLTAISIPNSLLYEDDNKTYEYSLVISKELENGYRIIIKNGYGNIFNGTITAEDKTDINLEDIEQKITKNIVLIKGE